MLSTNQEDQGKKEKEDIPFNCLPLTESKGKEGLALGAGLFSFVVFLFVFVFVFSTEGDERDATKGREEGAVLCEEKSKGKKALLLRHSSHLIGRFFSTAFYLLKKPKETTGGKRDCKGTKSKGMAFSRLVSSCLIGWRLPFAFC